MEPVEVPEHPPITRRQQFKVKSVIKEEKLAKKGKGKGKSGAELKGKGKGKRGKGKGKKAKKSKKISSSKKFGPGLSSKRCMLFKSNRTKKGKGKGSKGTGRASKKRPTDSSVVESKDHKIPKQDSPGTKDLEQAHAPQSTELQPSKTNLKATKTSGMVCKSKSKSTCKEQ